MKIKLPESALSVIQTDVLEVFADYESYGVEGEELTGMEVIAEHLHGDYLYLTPQIEWTCAAEVLLDLSNNYDSQKEGGYGEGQDKRFCSNAARALATIWRKIYDYLASQGLLQGYDVSDY